jgi:hypothetical protein
MKILDQIAFKFTGKKIPVFRIADQDEQTGQVKSLQDMGYCRDDPNTIQYTWENKGWEKTHGVNSIQKITVNGITEQCYVVSKKGQVVNLYTEPYKGPALENVVGTMQGVDMIALSMGLYPSMREKAVFMLIGIALGWLIIGPILNTMMS